MTVVVVIPAHAAPAPMVLVMVIPVLGGIRVYRLDTRSGLVLGCRGVGDGGPARLAVDRRLALVCAARALLSGPSRDRDVVGRLRLSFVLHRRCVLRCRVPPQLAPAVSTTIPAPALPVSVGWVAIAIAVVRRRVEATYDDSD